MAANCLVEIIGTLARARTIALDMRTAQKKTGDERKGHKTDGLLTCVFTPISDPEQVTGSQEQPTVVRVEGVNRAIESCHQVSVLFNLHQMLLQFG